MTDFTNYAINKRGGYAVNKKGRGGALKGTKDPRARSPKKVYRAQARGSSK